MQIFRKNSEKKITGSFFQRSTRYQTRLFLSFLTVAVPVFVLILALSAIFLQHSSYETVQKSQQSEMQQIGDQLSYILTDTANISQEIYYNESVQNMMQNAYRGEKYPSTSRVAYYINNFAADRDFVDSVVLTGKHSTLFSTERAYSNVSAFSNIREKWWYPVMTSRKQTYYWFPSPETSLIMRNSLTKEKITAENQLVFTRPVYSMQDYKTLLGYMMIYVSSDYLQDIWKSCQWGDTTNILLYAKPGQNAVSDTGKETDNFILMAGNRTSADYSGLLRQTDLSQQSSSLLRSGFQRYILTTQTLRSNGWILCMITPLREVSNFASVLAMEILIMAGIMTVLLIFFLQFNVRNMARPITDLSAIMNDYRRIQKTKDSDSEGMDQFTGSVSPDIVRSYEAREDEIGEIYRSYGQLLKRLNRLVQENYVKNLEKKDAELALLQSQINPHFLYNTLDSINWLALVNGQEKISSMITALSDTFRLSLIKSNSQYITLEHELQYIDSYLTLQKLRYGERLTYEIRKPDPLPLLYIPRFILQPIVENSLKHGIDMTDDESGRILIDMEIGENLLIRVINDGNEIDLKQMKEILAFHPGKNELLVFKGKGYGVQNIHRRIRMLCGSEYGLSYEKTDTQTICSVLLPIKKEDDSSFR